MEDFIGRIDVSAQNARDAICVAICDDEAFMLDLLEEKVKKMLPSAVTERFYFWTYRCRSWMAWKQQGFSAGGRGMRSLYLLQQRRSMSSKRLMLGRSIIWLNLYPMINSMRSLEMRCKKSDAEREAAMEMMGNI